MTDLSAFGDDERELILEAPGTVVKGAVVADGKTTPMGFFKEMAAAAKVFKAAGTDANPFVQAVSAAIKERPRKGGDPDAAAEHVERGLPFAESSITEALDQTREAMALVRAKADPADAEAYGAWLVRLATEVASAVKTREGGLFSRRTAISLGERQYLDELAAAVEAG